jgi:hypothetical protein
MIALKAAHDALSGKLRPQLAGYGFIDDALLPAAALAEPEEVHT